MAVTVCKGISTEGCMALSDTQKKTKAYAVAAYAILITGRAYGGL